MYSTNIELTPPLISHDQHLKLCLSMIRHEHWWKVESFDFTKDDLSDFAKRCNWFNIPRTLANAGKIGEAVEIYNALWREDPKLSRHEIESLLLLA